MSTVSKQIADDVIAGKYAEDGIVAIVRYENMFNGAHAYKLLFRRDPSWRASMQYMLDGKIPSMINCTVYWTAPSEKE